MFGSFTNKEFEVLRQLGRETAEIAAKDEMKVNKEHWRRVNDLESNRPVAVAYSLPWNEMNVDDELTLVCENPFLKEIETELRRQLYQYRHMPMDMVVEPFVRSKIYYNDSGYGVEVVAETRKNDPNAKVENHKYVPQIVGMDDIKKIKDPVIIYDKAKTEKSLEIFHDIFDGIIGVQKYCYLGPFWSSWDNLIQLIGVQELFSYIYEDPEFLNVLTQRYVEASIKKFKQFEDLGILTQNNDNVLGIACAGTGGYRYTNQIPLVAKEQNVKLKDLWGGSAAQIFTHIAPEMFDELCIQYEKPLLEMYAKTYYGCCEVLSDKMESIRKVNNLRKLTVSAWENPVAAAEQICGDYVYSFKPAVSVLAYETLNENELKKHLHEYISAAVEHKCNTEVILKTVSTIRYKPQNLWRFAEMITEEIKANCGE